MCQSKTVLPPLTEISTQKEFEAALDEAQAWAASVGYKEEGVNDIIKAVRKKNRRSEFTKELKDIDIELAKFLLAQVEEHCYKWTYKEVAIELSKRLGRPVNAHLNLTHPLGNVMELCFDLNLPLITAIVFRGGTKENVGDGFYKLACELKPQYKAIEPYQAWKQELALIRQCRDWSALRNYLNKL